MAFMSESIDKIQRVNLSKQTYLAIENDQIVFVKTKEASVIFSTGL